MIQRFTANILSLGLLGVLGSIGCGEKSTTEDNNVDPTPAECQTDDNSEPASALELSSEETTGYVCPIGDLDWYKFSVPANETLVSVNVSMPVTISPIQPSYAIFPVGSEGDPELAVATPPANATGTRLSYVHCVAPGDYYMVVRDSGDNQADTRNAYSTNIATAADPDPQEPNNDRAASQALVDGQATTGYIACRSDEDWYQIDVPAGRTLQVELRAPNGGFQPKLRLLSEDDTLLFEVENASNTADTDINRLQVPPGPGTYYVVISDDDNQDADPETPYELTVTLINDEDPNEPNNTPEEATELSQSVVNCGGTWSNVLSSVGTIGSPGDDDWFRVDLSGCAPGVVEAEVEYPTVGDAASQWEFNAEVQATVTIVKPHPESSCDQDSDCNTLQIPCDNAFDCAGVFDTCLSQGLCAGASVCLPNNVCGANVMQRRYECAPRASECRPGSTPPPENMARAAAPVSSNVVYIRVSDFQSNGSAPDRLYNLRVRVRSITDTNEPNNAVLNIVSPDYSTSDLAAQAVDIPIRDCTAGDCCTGPGQITGSIDYDSDSDWFRIPHPCPDSDCTLRMVWQTDAGPTDIAMNIYRSGGGSWNVARDPDEEENQSADSGVLGGTMAGNGCFYAFQGHNDNGYLIEVRDRTAIFSDDQTVIPSSRDWDPDQNYSFCIEKVSNVCEEPPCRIYPNGCGVP